VAAGPGWSPGPVRARDALYHLFTKAIRDQVEVTRRLRPKGKDAVFHFTLYGETLGRRDERTAGAFLL